MPQAVDSIQSVLEELNQRLRTLEDRIAALEASPALVSGSGSSQNRAAVSADSSLRRKMERPRGLLWGLLPGFDIQGGAIPVVGKAVLGIAGAYLLRAIAESGSVSKFPVLLIAMLYAGFWMAWAARTHSANRLASGTYAITSALILSPLLWESTVRFQALSPAFSAVVLVLYVILAITLAWRNNLQVIPWSATLASVIAASGLIIATHELASFSAALLAVACATEIAVCTGRRVTWRAIPAAFADFAIWLVISILASPDSVPEGYHSASASTVTALCFLLLAMYAGSIAVRVFVLKHRLTIFELVQSALAFGLAWFGTMRATGNKISLELGVLFLTIAAVCYWGTLFRFVDVACTRNRRVTANWAAALLLAGSFLLFTVNLQIAFLCAAALATAFVYTRTRKLSLGMHASFYLAAGAAISPLPVYAARALGGTMPGLPDFPTIAVGLAAAVCYSVGALVKEGNPRRRMLWLVPAGVVGFTAAAVTIVGTAYLIAARLQLEASGLSVVRTVVNCALAVVLGFLGSRTERVELRWLAYAAVAFGTLKLVFEDLRFGNAASLVISLLFYGLVLILLPRPTRREVPEAS
jgi:hypothetical protein